MTTLIPNPAFIRDIPVEHRKRWADALVNCDGL